MHCTHSNSAQPFVISIGNLHCKAVLETWPYSLVTKHSNLAGSCFNSFHFLFAFFSSPIMHFLTFPFLSIPLPFFIPFTFPSSVSCAYILNHHLWVFAHVPLISHSFSLHEKCSLILFSLHEQCSLMLLANKHKTTYRKHISHEHVYRNKVFTCSVTHILLEHSRNRSNQQP